MVDRGSGSFESAEDDSKSFDQYISENPETISIEPYRAIGNNKALMEILLSDHNTGKNLLWVTDNYSSEGVGFDSHDTIQYLFIINPNRIIRPRYLKSQSEQRNRSKDMAEVFTPPWIVNKQNNLVDEQWFGRGSVFNTESGLTWTPTDEVTFEDSDWCKYVKSVRMEVSCGEAPYLTTRYDPITGVMIPVRYRVGILDRKLRVVSENVSTPMKWIEWAKAAIRSVYAYDIQGDNVLLARENLLLTFAEHYYEAFKEEPSWSTISSVAQILSWNVWQMDGMRGVVPFSCEMQCGLGPGGAVMNSCPACRLGKGRHSGRYCRIMDWETDSVVEFASLMGRHEECVVKPVKCTTLDTFGVEL